VARTQWREAIRQIRPNLIYALLNWQAVPFAHEVLRETPDVPFVWHFKEGPFNCLEKGTWPQLVDLLTRSHGQIYASPELRAWFHTVVPRTRNGQSIFLDGDLPKREWITNDRSPLLSANDGALHTVVAGRPVGMDAPFVGELARRNIHLHLYGDFIQNRMSTWIADSLQAAPQHLHLHPAVDQRSWVSELSQYDAGWLHVFRSRNQGRLQAANWDDLNYPARLATLVAAGLPSLQCDNTGSIVAMQTITRERQLGVLFTDVDDLANQLSDPTRQAQLRDSIWGQREQFTFDYHADGLLAFFREVIDRFSSQH
jgi:hypothetical protein